MIRSSFGLLFICLGNICRSPAAEGIFAKMIKDEGMQDVCCVDSAGIGNWHEGQLPDQRMRERGALRGYRFDSRARQVKRADFDRFTYIVAMDHDNVKALNALASTKEHRAKILCAADFMTRHPQYDTVPDPYYGGTDDLIWPRPHRGCLRGADEICQEGYQR